MADIEQELADWIQVEVIAKAILEAMQECGFKPSLPHAKRIWLHVLECELHDAIKAHVLNFAA